jgi:hypothetical protein
MTEPKGWHAILNMSMGMKVGPCRKTRAEAEADAEEWRQHIARLSRKPKGQVHVVTARKLGAMMLSCSVRP